MPLRKTTEAFVQEARLINGDAYIYDKVDYKNSYSKVVITCRKHGDFLQRPNGHLQGQGCKKCYNEQLTKPSEEFIQSAKEVHGDKYTYSKTYYKTRNSNVIITCPVHGDFSQRADVHLRGNGCKKCSVDTQTKTAEDFIHSVKELHGDKYNYNFVDYKSDRKKVEIICDIHCSFFQTPRNHLKGRGCPRCVNRTSKPAKMWLKSLGIPNLIYDDGINSEWNVPGTRYSADGYDPETNTIYEFQGDYWHGNPDVYNPEEYNKTTKCSYGELYRRTLEKKETLINLGYNYIEMWESDFVNI